MAAIQSMTFLQLARRLRQEGRGSGTDTTPTTVVGATGDSKDYCDWIAESWNRLQNEKSWRWMFAEKTITWDAAERTQTLAEIFTVQADLDRFSHWKADSFTYYPTADGVATERPIAHLPWEQYLAEEYGTVQSVNRPSHVVVLNNDSLRLKQSPSVAGTMNARYYKKPQLLSVDADVPEMPAEFHMFLVWDALIDHAVADIASEQYQRAINRREMLWYQLMNRQLEPVRNYSRTMG